MARLRFTPQKREFFELYAQASANTVEIARLLVELLERFPEDGERARSRRIKEREHEGDRLTHEVVTLLNRTFVTPFDRDDMYRLAGALDDICDHIDEAADNLGSTASSACPRRRAQQARGDPPRRDEARRGGRPAQRLQGLEAISWPSCASSRTRATQLERDAVAELFRSTDDAKAIIRWKDIHERLEEAVDALENAADVLEAIVVKNR